MKRKIIFTIIMLALPLVFLEGLSYLGLYIFKKVANQSYVPQVKDELISLNREDLQKIINGEKPYLDFDPVLGTIMNPNASQKDGLYQANSQGIRGSREYSKVPDQNILRIAAFGDSYTHASDVSNADAWMNQLELISKNQKGQLPQFETLNFGIGGYGLDQAMMRYEVQGRFYQPKIVLIGFMSENINRHVNTFRPFLAPISPPFPKPRFFIGEDGELKLQGISQWFKSKEDLGLFLKNESKYLQEFGKTDYWYQVDQYVKGPLDFLASVRLAKLIIHLIKPEFFYRYSDTNLPIVIDGKYNAQSEAYQLTTKIFDRFYQDVLDQNAIPLIVIFPRNKDVKRYKKDHQEVYAPLLQDLQKKGYCTIDIMQALDKSGQDVSNLFVKTKGHYSPLGNKIVAQAIFDFLNSRLVQSPEGLKLECHQ